MLKLRFSHAQFLSFNIILHSGCKKRKPTPGKGKHTKVFRLNGIFFIHLDNILHHAYGGVRGGCNKFYFLL